MDDVPDWLVPVITLLQEKAQQNPSVIGYGVFDVHTAYRKHVENDEADIVIGVNRGFKNFDPHTFYINRSLYGEECSVVLFQVDGVNYPNEHPNGGKAFFETPQRIEEIANYIWNYYVRRRQTDKMPRLSRVT